MLYHAGTGRIVLIGSIKMTTIFFFCFSVGVIAPWQYNLPESPAWMPLAGSVTQSSQSLSLTNVIIVIVGGSIPMLVVMRTTAPFVTYAHLKLPFHARRSRDHIAKFVEKVPPHTEIDLTTIGNFGWAHVYRMPLFELRKTKYRFSVANLRRVPSFLSQTSKRAWWKGSLPTNFYIADERVRRGSSTLWQRVLEQLKTA